MKFITLMILILFSFSLMNCGVGHKDTEKENFLSTCRDSDLSNYYYNWFTEKCYINNEKGIEETECSVEVVNRIIQCKKYVNNSNYRDSF